MRQGISGQGFERTRKQHDIYSDPALKQWRSSGFHGEPRALLGRRTKCRPTRYGKSR
jgi:hypothetical protein